MRTLQEQLRDKASPMYFTVRSEAANKIDEQEKLIDELRAKLQAPAIDERAEFEKWAKENATERFPDLSREGDGYFGASTDWAWKAWQARAKLAQAQAQSCATQAASDEPVAIVTSTNDAGIEWQVRNGPPLKDGDELYTRPQPAKATPETAVVPDEAIEKICSIAIWLDNSATMQQSRFDEPPEPASWFDYQLLQYAHELHGIAAMLKGEKCQ